MSTRYTDLVRDGEDAVARKDYETGRKKFADALAIRSSFPPLLARHAQCCIEVGDLESAWQSLTRLILLMPHNRAAKAQVAKLSVSLQKPGAQELTKELLRDNWSYLKTKLTKKRWRKKRATSNDPNLSWLILDGLTEEQRNRAREAGTQLNRRNLEEARLPIDRLFEEVPDHPSAQQLLGCYLLRLNLYLRAIESFEKVLEQRPDSTPARCDLAIAFAIADRPEDALAALDEVNPADRNTPDYISALVAIKRISGDYEAAIELLLELEGRGETSSQNAERLARIYLWSGQFEEAAKWAEIATERSPDSGDPFLITATARQLRTDTPFFDKALKAANNPTMSMEERSKVEFALGKAYTAAKQYDIGFDHFVRANTLADRSYDANLEQEEIDKRIGLFTPELMDRLLDSDRDTGRGKGIVFVCGMPRSGSTLVAQVLASHPEAVSIGESQLYQTCLQKAEDAGYPDELATLPGEFFEDLGQQYLDRLPPEAKKSNVIIDKELMKFTNLGMFRLMLPGAKFVHTMRNPLDTGFSIFCQRFSGTLPFAYRQDTIAHFLHLHDEIMSHWHRIMPGIIHTVRYEELVEDSEQIIRNLLAAVGLDFHPDCLNFDQSKSQVTTSSAYQVRQKIYSSSINAWERHRDGLKPLIDGIEKKPFN